MILKSFRVAVVGSVVLALYLLSAAGGPAWTPDAMSAEEKVVYFDTGFEDGKLAPFYPARCDRGCLPPMVTSEAAHSGKRAVKMATTSSQGWHSALQFRWCRDTPPNNSGSLPCNPAATDPSGLYQRFWIMLPQSTIDAVAEGKQVKLLLNRYDIDRSNQANRGGWWQTGFGLDFGSVPRNEVRTFEDAGVDPRTNKTTGIRLTGGVWYKFETWYRRDTSEKKGRAILWINGKQVADSGWLPGMGRDEPRAEQAAWYGLVYARTKAPLVAYIDDVAAANHRLD